MLGKIALNMNIGNHTFEQKCVLVDYLFILVLIWLNFIIQFKPIIINFDIRSCYICQWKIKKGWKYRID